MKKITAILLTMVLMASFLVGCGKKRELYNKVDLKEFVTLEEYKGIVVDTTTDSFAKIYKEIFADDIYMHSLYKDVKEGTVQNGDVVNLDYEGKLNGVAFEGGTAKGATLEIGSKTFIDDFEEELIGVTIGDTKDVTATFPTPYQNNPDLAGKEAIFTCKINSLQRPMTVEEAFEKAGFKTVDEYKANIKERAAKQYILDYVCDKATIKEYPKAEIEKLTEAIYEHFVYVCKQMYNADISNVLAASGKTIEQYKKEIQTQMVPSMMDVNMIMYYVLDAEKLEILESTIQRQETTQPAVAESYAVQEIVLSYLYENAEIK